MNLRYNTIEFFVLYHEKLAWYNITKFRVIIPGSFLPCRDQCSWYIESILIYRCTILHVIFPCNPLFRSIKIRYWKIYNLLINSFVGTKNLIIYTRLLCNWTICLKSPNCARIFFQLYLTSFELKNLYSGGFLDHGIQNWCQILETKMAI